MNHIVKTPASLLNSPEAKLSDEELIQRISAGNSKLYGLIYSRYSNKVFRKCLSFVKNEEMAQDMVQDVFLKVYKQLEKFQGKSRFSTWLYAITYNFCVEHYRKNNRFMTVDVDERLEISDNQEKEEKELLKFRVDLLQKALTQISPEDKKILLMKYQRSTPIKDIMNELDISESAVKMRLSRARQRVKEIVQKLESKNS